MTGGGDRVARVWTVDDIAAGPTTLRGHDDGVTGLSPSARTDSRWRREVRTDGPGCGTSPARPNPLLPAAPGGRVSAVAFSADGRWLATGSEDDAARLWDLRRPGRRPPSPIVLPHDDDVEAVAFSSARPEQGDSSHWLVTEAGTAPLGATTSIDLYADPLVWGGHEGPVASVAFGAGDRWVVTGSDDGTARLWGLEHPSIQPAVLDHGVDAAGDGGGGRRDRLQRGRAVVSPPARATRSCGCGTSTTRRGAQCSSTTRSSRGTRKLGSPRSRSARTGAGWPPAAGTGSSGCGTSREPSADPTAEPAFDAMVTALAFSPDRRQLAVGRQGQRRRTSSDTDRPDRRTTPLAGHEDEVTSVAFSADGTRLATGSRDGTVASGTSTT